MAFEIKLLIDADDDDDNFDQLTDAEPSDNSQPRTHRSVDQ